MRKNDLISIHLFENFHEVIDFKDKTIPMAECWAVGHSVFRHSEYFPLNWTFYEAECWFTNKTKIIDTPNRQFHCYSKSEVGLWHKTRLYSIGSIRSQKQSFLQGEICISYWIGMANEWYSRDEILFVCSFINGQIHWKWKCHINFKVYFQNWYIVSDVPNRI